MKRKCMKHAAAVMTFVLATANIYAIPLKAEATAEVSEEQLAKADADNDGLFDYLEDYFGTDKTIKDTDEDGLSDFVEVTQLKSDPLKQDSDKNGILDGDEDVDEDGLSNRLELQIGTSPVNRDTDGDGLSDSEEVNGYQTSPVLEDSDNDGLLDGEEVALNLSPIKKYTKSLQKDGSRLFAQTLGRTNIEAVLRSSKNAAIPSLSGNLPGQMERNVSIISSTVVLDKMVDQIVGMPVDILTQYEDDSDMKLSFSCTKATAKQIKNYVIGHFKDGNITYLKTSISKKKLSADITEGGTYFVALKADKANVTASTSSGNAVFMSTTRAYALASSSADSDYDGVPDSQDPKPNDNSFSGEVKNGGFDINSHVAYAIDYRTFFGTPSTFSSQLCKASSIYANMSYGFNYSDEASGKTFSFTDLMKYQGLSDVAYYDLGSYYSDNHISKFYIGHRTVTYNGKTKNIIAVSIQGTDSGIKQWDSNFDIGSTATFNSYPDWTVVNNHKGFDIAATRIQKLIQTYVGNYCSNSNAKTYWITGHSRGAAIANILSAKLTDAGSTVFGYTFATPNTTTKSASATAKYTSIFNLVNKDDFVPCLPCKVWGFRLYGRTSTESIADNYETEWEDLTGIWDYDPDTFGMEDTVSELGDVISERNKAYTYTCSCHGDGSNNDITIRNYGMSESSREGAIAKIPSNALPYCKITRYKGTAFWGWDFENCETPCYFMQVLAAKMAGTISDYRFVVELDIAEHYESAKTAIISSALGGLEHPHYTESYYILAKHADASKFK